MKPLGFAEKRSIQPQEGSNILNLSADIETYIGDYRDRIESALKNGNADAQAVLSDIDKRTEHIKRMAEEMPYNLADMDQSGLKLTYAEYQKLSQARAEMGKDFVEAIVAFYRVLQGKINVLKTKLETRGVKYVMNGSDKYNEEIAHDLDEILRFMVFGFKEMGKKTLTRISPEYANLNHSDNEISSVFHLDSINMAGIEKGEFSGDSVAYQLELIKLNEIFDLLQGEGSPEEIKRKMMELTARIFTHIGDDLGSQAGSIIGKVSHEETAERGIEYLKKSPVQQMEFILDIVVRTIRVNANIDLQRKLLIDGGVMHPQNNKGVVIIS